jgi:uncharacterized protein
MMVDTPGPATGPGGAGPSPGPVTGDVPGGRGRRWPRVAAFSAAYGAAGLALLVPTSSAGAGWYLATQLLDANTSRPYPVRVHSVSDGRAVLSRTPDLKRPIPLGLAWPTGHAQLGALLAMEKSTVVREVTAVDRGVLRPGTRACTTARVFDGDPLSARGLPYSEVIVHGELGALPAWLVPPTAPARDTWIIAVHGWRAPRGDALRVLPALAATGMPTLVVTYRNDEGAPPSPDRCYHLGDTEWRDLAAAIRYALANGARDVVLLGWSMGGAIALNLLRRAPEARAVRGLVLDCPVVDWTSTLRMHAQSLRLPDPWTWASIRLVQRRLGARLAELDHRRYAEQLSVPTLIFVDDSDATVAAEPTREYAAMRPDLITLVETEQSGHCRSWNLDPARYEKAVGDFLADLG